jgi:hypothetical protein
MTNRRHKKRPLKRPLNRSRQVALDDLAVGNKITHYHTQIIALALAPSFYLIVQKNWMIERTGSFVKWWVLFLWIMGLVGTFFAHAYPLPTPYQGDTRAYRRRAVFLLALAIFANIMSWVPIIYASGVFSLIISRFPGRGTLGANFYLVAGFIVGAICSGVLGNLAYDILKYVAKRMREKK